MSWNYLLLYTSFFLSSLPKRNTFKLGFLFQDEVLVCQGKDPMKTLDTLGRLTKSFTLDPFLLRDSGTDDTDEVGRRVDEDNDENIEDAATGAAAAEHRPLVVLKCKIDIGNLHRA